MRSLICIFLFGILLSAAGCSNAKRAQRLAAHHERISQAAQAANLSPEAKFDTLAQSLVAAMHEGLNIANPAKGKKYVSSYFKQNKGDMVQILEELAVWQLDMNEVQRMGFGLRLVTKPYSGDFVRLFPKFYRRYRQVSFMNDFGKKLKSTIFNNGTFKIDF
ncbi:MAG: hypothetical protein IPL35_12425 [Sphingobacteriales bacterium]|nr:hypothetical protein [Sphingobacteriales bacterium]